MTLLTGCDLLMAEEKNQVIVEDSTQDKIDESKETLTDEEKRQQILINALPETVSLSDWELILVNNDHPLPEQFEVELKEVEPDKWIDERIADNYTALRDMALENGHRLFFASGYRSVERQQANYDRSINSYIEQGHSKEEARALTEDYIAIPNHSEHHTGLALDIVDQEWIADGNGLVPEYDTQMSQQWLIETAPAFGFILRYPEGKEEVTGINYESWHFRYVGKESAVYIHEHELVLEEYIELLESRENKSKLTEQNG